jgi:hypothetical protein
VRHHASFGNRAECCKEALNAPVSDHENDRFGEDRAMNRRVSGCALAVALVVIPFAALAKTAPAHPDGALPFGRWTIVNGQVDESAIVWSRCRAANGQAGRWVATHPAEVVHPTYVVQREPLLGTPSSPAAKLGTLVECVGEDGAPGVPEPAVPATAVLERGTTLVYAPTVGVHQTDETARHVHASEFGLHEGETAFDDGSGPVVVTASRIAVFPQTSTLVMMGSSGGLMTIHRPSEPVPAAPTSCRVVAFDNHGASHDVGAEAGSCTALSNAERQRVVRQARAKLAAAPR